MKNITNHRDARPLHILQEKSLPQRCLKNKISVCDMLITLFLISSLSSKIYHHSLFITHMTISTLLIVAVCRTHVTHEPQLTTVFHNSVVRLSDRCTGGHRFNSCQGLRFFLCPVLVTC